MSQKSPNAKERRVLNVYVGTPGRLAKLADMKAFEVEKGDRFRLLMVDMRKNKKDQTVFEVRETGRDAIEVILGTRESLKAGSLKIMLL